MSEYFNISESAKFLGISRRYLYILMERGRIEKPIKIASRMKVYEKGYLEAVKNGIKKYRDGSTQTKIAG